MFMILVFSRCMRKTEIRTPTIAKRLVKPLTSVGSAENFCRNASLRLCAGSVEITNTFFL